MCLPDCKECRRKALRRREILTNVLVGAAFLSGILSLWVMGTTHDQALTILGIFIAAGLLGCAALCERG